MSELGSGNGSSYPGALDTDSAIESTATLARADVPNDLAAAIVATQTELGTDPAGSKPNVKTFLQTEHEADGTHSTITPTSVNVNGSTKTITKVLDEDDMASDSDTALATQQSTKAYIDNTNTEDYIHIQEQAAQNTAGGTFTSGAWRTRVLTNEITDTGGDAALASNQITLQAGTYRCRITAPGHLVNAHQARLYNITDAAIEILGHQAIDLGGLANLRSEVVGRFTIASVKVFEIQHQCISTRATDGFGSAGNITTEIYTVAEFWKEVG